jgi:hypothetical protein
MNLNDFYKYNKTQPYHISVGGVLFNDNFEICVHHFFKKDLPEETHFLMDYLDEAYILMRETLEGKESLYEAVVRGMLEEFGVEVEVDKYLGAKIDTVTGPVEAPFEKLTVYHAAKLTRQGERKFFDIENKSKMEWHKPEALLHIFNQQVQKTNRPELDERVVVERFIKAYNL